MEGSGGGKRRVTAREAATLLGVHYNTVRNRIKAGTIQAEKVITEHGETWMIDPDTLTDNAPTSADQQLVGRVPEEALTVLAREIVREAGFVPDPRAQERKEAMEARRDVFKHFTTVGVTGVIVVGLLYRDFGFSVTGIRMALLFLAASVVLSLLGLVTISIHPRAPGRWSDPYFYIWNGLVYAAGAALLLAVSALIPPLFPR